MILIARLLLAPNAPAQRALPFDTAARTLYRGVVDPRRMWASYGVPARALLEVTRPRERA